MFAILFFLIEYPAAKRFNMLFVVSLCSLTILMGEIHLYTTIYKLLQG
jgi:hypothetical protein